MGNQLIREQVFDVLFNYVKIADGIYTESDCATVRDEIMLALDQSQFTADEAEYHINQEVERRITERMSDDEIKSIALRYAPIMMYAGITCMEDVNLSIRQDVIEMLVNLRSRLTNPGVKDSQKTEGGGNG